MRSTRDLSSASTSPPARWLASRTSTIGVCSWPGTTVFTRMPLLAYCTATTRENWITPAFDGGIADLRRAGPAQAGGGGKIDDRAAALALHDRQHVLAGEKYALEVVVDLAVPGRFRQLDRTAGSRAADVVDQHVDAAERGQAGLDHGLRPTRCRSRRTRAL